MNVQSLAQVTFGNQPRLEIVRRNGMTQLKDIRKFAKDCVVNYASLYHNEPYHSLFVSQLPDFVVHEFASLIMSTDETYAIEACGPDNANWRNDLLPSLISFLKDSTDDDKAIHFMETWKSKVVEYFYPHMQSLIDDALYEYDRDQGNIR